jgi:hypothetical protein
MKSEFTAETRPRSSLGVPSWESVIRITTLTLSADPATPSARNERR